MEANSIPQQPPTAPQAAPLSASPPPMSHSGANSNESGQGSTPTGVAWYQQTINNLLGKTSQSQEAPAPNQPQTNSSTSQPPPSSTASNPYSQESVTPLDPGFDENGYPTNEDWLINQYREQGISIPDLHREYLESQQQVDGLQQFYALIADPATRQQALAQFDQEYAQLQGAPSMPGGSGATDPVGMFNEAIARGTGTPHGRSLMGQVPAHITAQALMQSLPDL